MTTVNELINVLKKCDPQAEVMCFWGGQPRIGYISNGNDGGVGSDVIIISDADYYIQEVRGQGKMLIRCDE